MKIAILGFGREGKAILKFLKKSAQYKGAKISILDKKTDKNYLKNLAEFDVIFRSPGVPYNLPEIQNAIKPRSRASSLRGKKGVKFSSATNLFFQNAKKIGCKIIGITGTKGKGTTSTLLYKILKAAKKDVYLAGNIGKPALEILPKLKKNSIVILELSSFQLQDLKHSPDIAVVLNIFEDHLDSHKNFKEYAESKANIAKWQSASRRKSDKIFYDASNKWSRWIAQKSKAIKIPINISFSNSREWFHKIKSIIKTPGEHNFKNALIAATVAKSLGIPENIILKTVKNYRGMEHRLELVHSNILKNVGMNFYNDSASTNPHTAAAAIRAFPNQPKILICGGKDKNLDYIPLAKALKNSNTKMIILFGENKKKIHKVISNQGLVIKNVKNLKSAIQFAYKTAKSLVTSYQLPVTILFSPAAASFDMFKDYKDRGDKFKKMVKGLK